MLLLGTANRHKAHEFQVLLAGTGLTLQTLADVSAPLEIAETGSSLAENARLKAQGLAAHFGCWVLADDTGLEVAALQGAPGVRSARYAGPQADAAANRRFLLEQLTDVPQDQRQARFVCTLALADPTGALWAESVGSCGGRIRSEPAGERAFGYDCLFEIVEYHRTLAQLGAAAQSRLTHRARAVERLILAITPLLSRGI
jgi:XTP/dITP diphosphohydrolase